MNKWTKNILLLPKYLACYTLGYGPVLQKAMLMGFWNFAGISVRQLKGSKELGVARFLFEQVTLSWTSDDVLSFFSTKCFFPKDRLRPKALEVLAC